MDQPRVVIDTNVLVAGLRSQSGASFRLVQEIGRGLFELNLSVPLVIEYEDVLTRPSTRLTVSTEAIGRLLNYICEVGNHHKVFFLWRPYLRDPKDDTVLELAVKSGSSVIVTFNKKDFEGSERFGVRAITPADFLRSIGVIA
jgi:putative PIN family toxin of toxin-antitoxin system